MKDGSRPPSRYRSRGYRQPMQVRALGACAQRTEESRWRNVPAWQWLQEEFARNLKAVPFDLDAVGLADASSCENARKNSACQTPGSLMISELLCLVPTRSVSTPS